VCELSTLAALGGRTSQRAHFLRVDGREGRGGKKRGRGGGRLKITSIDPTST